MYKQFCLILMLSLTGCSSFQSSDNRQEIDTSMVSGKYFNNDGFGNNIHLILHEDGRYESNLEGPIGIASYSNGAWSKVDNKISFLPEGDSGFLRRALSPMTILKNDNDVLLVPSKKVEVHQQLMADFGKSTYKYSRITF